MIHFLFGFRPIFRGELAVSFREGTSSNGVFFPLFSFHGCTWFDMLAG